jgi:hypothetical protein
MASIQEQMERIVDMYLSQASGMETRMSRKALAEWSKIYRSGFESFKKTVDENFKRVESFFPKQGDPARTGHVSEQAFPWTLMPGDPRFQEKLIDQNTRTFLAISGTDQASRPISTAFTGMFFDFIGPFLGGPNSFLAMEKVKIGE